jgi:hypothetical protein
MGIGVPGSGNSNLAGTGLVDECMQHYHVLGGKKGALPSRMTASPGSGLATAIGWDGQPALRGSFGGIYEYSAPAGREGNNAQVQEIETTWRA